MASSVIYRRGNLDDLSRLSFAQGLSVTTESIEFNVVGMGHELWLAVMGNSIVGVTVLGNTAPNQRTVMYLQVADLYAGQGIGSAVLIAAIENYPDSEFTVIPFEGTEEFYRRLGFEKSGQRNKIETLMMMN